MARLLGVRPLDRRRAHAVKLADLRVALQHLQAVGVVRDLKRRRRHHAAAAEAARLVALHAALKLLRARRAGDVVHVLLLRRRRDVEQELGRHHEHVRGDLYGKAGTGRETQNADGGARGGQRAPGTAPCAPSPSRCTCPGRALSGGRGGRVSRGRGKVHAIFDTMRENAPSFCTIAYWLTSCAIAVRTLRFGRRPFCMSSARDGKGRVRTGIERHAVRKRRAYSGSRSSCTSGSCRERRSCRSARGRAGRERGRGAGAARRREPAHHADAAAANGRGGGR